MASSLPTRTVHSRIYASSLGSWSSLHRESKTGGRHHCCNKRTFFMHDEPTSHNLSRWNTAVSRPQKLRLTENYGKPEFVQSRPQNCRLAGLESAISGWTKCSRNIGTICQTKRGGSGAVGWGLRPGLRGDGRPWETETKGQYYQSI